MFLNDNQSKGEKPGVARVSESGKLLTSQWVKRRRQRVGEKRKEWQIFVFNPAHYRNVDTV